MKPVFISYVRENVELVDKLHQELESYGIKVWRDLQRLNPGDRWKQKIQKAIREGAFFLACFSKEYYDRAESYMNEELTIAIERLRRLHTDRVWFIPIKLNRCQIPDRNIGGGETLNDLQYVKLYENWDVGIQELIKRLYELVLEDCNKAVELNPEDYKVYTARSLIYQQQQQYELALEDCNKAVELNPSEPMLFYNRGWIYNLKGESELALADYSQAIELGSQNASLYYTRGLNYHHKREYDLAIRDFGETIELGSDPEKALALYFRGEAWLHLQKWERAKSDLMNAEAMDADIIFLFYSQHATVENFAQKTGIQLPPDIAEMLTQQ